MGIKNPEHVDKAGDENRFINIEPVAHAELDGIIERNGIPLRLPDIKLLKGGMK